jgi:hypothetical protein
MDEVTGALAEQLEALENGGIEWFADWPVRTVPTSGALVYTVWDREHAFVYVGMSGRMGTKQSQRGKGPYGRLESHASGRRSGDQFCVYVSDRFILPRLQNRIQDIADGSLSLDEETRRYVRGNLGFRWTSAADGRTALDLENRVQRGALRAGKPLLSPK